MGALKDFRLICMGKGGIGKVMTNELVLAEELRTELQLAFVSILD